MPDPVKSSAKLTTSNTLGQRNQLFGLAGYVRNMQAWNDPLYKQIADTLPKDEELADYVVSLSIAAQKQH